MFILVNIFYVLRKCKVDKKRFKKIFFLNFGKGSDYVYRVFNFKI